MPTPAPKSPVWVGNNTTLVELANSGEKVFGDKVRLVKRYSSTYAVCLAAALSKGTTGSGGTAGYRVSQSTVTKDRGGMGFLTIDWEANSSSSGADLPPDEYGLLPFEVNPRLEQHPLFAALTDAQREDVREAIDHSDINNRKSAIAALTGEPLLLAQKLLKGIDSYYLAGWTYQWTFYGWTIPTISDGGVVETPGGPLDGYLGTGVDWLRQADSYEFTGTHHRLTRTWLGGPTGHWDSDLY